MPNLIEGTRHSLIHRGRMWWGFSSYICQDTEWIPNMIAGLTGCLQDIVVGSRLRIRHRVQGIRRMPNHHLCSGEENPDYWQKAVLSLVVASIRCLRKKVADSLACDINNWLHPWSSAHDYWAGTAAKVSKGLGGGKSGHCWLLLLLLSGTHSLKCQV